LNFDPAGSVFVIFRTAADPQEHVVSAWSKLPSESIAPMKLDIQRAIYAATDGAGELDVTAKLSESIREGQLVAVANNGGLGKDPAPDHRKELRVDYMLNGKAGHAAVVENETLKLPATPTVGEPRKWETMTTKDGPPFVKVWANGAVELRLSGGQVLEASTSDLPAPVEVSGPWTLSFPPNWGAPAEVVLDELISWPEHTNAGVRYFSGTATYENEVEIPAERLSAGREVWLDLGRVKNFAEVSLNGNDLGVLWKPPFRVNVTAVAKTGGNHLTVKVTNLWPNRLIGDEQRSADSEWDGDQLKAWPQWLIDGKASPTGRFTFTTWRHWRSDAPLLESGMLGPVKLESAEIIRAEAYAK